MEPVDRRHAFLDQAGGILREVADRDFVTPPDRAFVERVVADRDARGIRQQRAEQRRLADAVAAGQHDLFAARDDAAEAVDERRAAKRLGDVVELERDPARRPVHVELDERALDVRPRQLRRLQTFDFLLARHHLARAGAGGEARDEILQLLDFLFALVILGFDARADLHLGEDHLVVAAGIRDDRLVVDVR